MAEIGNLKTQIYNYSKTRFHPEPPAIEKVRRLMDDTNLVLDASNHTAYLSKVGQTIDLGGIAKGYATDEVRRLLTQGGVKSALINLGDNISHRLPTGRRALVNRHAEPGVRAGGIFRHPFRHR